MVHVPCIFTSPKNTKTGGTHPNRPPSHEQGCWGAGPPGSQDAKKDHVLNTCQSEGMNQLKLGGGFSPTHLKNMRKSNWIISSNRGENKKYI